MANEIKPPQVEPRRYAHASPSRRNPFWRLLGWGGVACIALVAVALTGQTEAGSKRLQPGTRLRQRQPARGRRSCRRVPAESRRRDPAPGRASARARRRPRAAQCAHRHARAQSRGHDRLDQAASAQQIAAVAHRPAATCCDPAGADARAAGPDQTAGAHAAACTGRPLATALVHAMRTPQVLEPPVPPQRSRCRAGSAAAGARRRRRTSAAAAGAEQSRIRHRSRRRRQSSKRCACIGRAMKANHGPLLEGLRADRHAAPEAARAGVTYRLVAGPLPNAAEAARLCARVPGHCAPAATRPSSMARSWPRIDCRARPRAA